MTLLRFLGKAALATNLTYRILVTSLLIAGTAYEFYKHQQRYLKLKAPHE